MTHFVASAIIAKSLPLIQLEASSGKRIAQEQGHS